MINRNDVQDMIDCHTDACVAPLWVIAHELRAIRTLMTGHAKITNVQARSEAAIAVAAADSEWDELGK